MDDGVNTLPFGHDWVINEMDKKHKLKFNLKKAEKYLVNNTASHKTLEQRIKEEGEMLFGGSWDYDENWVDNPEDWVTIDFTQ